MKKKINVLYVIPTLENADGVASYSMNYFRNMKNIKIDFIVTASEEKSKYYDEITKQKREVYYIRTNRIKKIVKTILQIKKFFKENSYKYDIIHCHVWNTGIFYLYFAKKYGIKVRILHSHATMTSDRTLKRIINNILLLFTKKLATHFFACSKYAGDRMFNDVPFLVINNAIDIEHFKFNNEKRKNIRQKLNLKDNDILIGNVGRLCYQKNQQFLINIVNKLNIESERFKLIIIGDGILFDELNKNIKDKMNKNLILMHSVSNIEDYFCAMDIFCLPSIYEGLPVVGIEAQANGLSCIFSSNITDEVKVNDNVYFENIDSIENWTKMIKKISIKRCNKNYIKQSNFIIENASSLLEKKYFELLKSRE